MHSRFTFPLTRNAPKALRLISITLIAGAAIGWPGPSQGDDLPPISQGTEGPPTLALTEHGAGSGNVFAEVDPSTGAARASLRLELPATTKGGVSEPCYNHSR
jgi:hypothetical protein